MGSGGRGSRRVLYVAVAAVPLLIAAPLAILGNLAADRLPPSLRVVADHPWPAFLGLSLVALVAGLILAAVPAPEPPVAMTGGATGPERAALLRRVELTLADARRRPDDVPAELQVPFAVEPPAVAGSGLSEVFDRSGRALLVLGGPGAGKSYAVVRLAADLLDRARADRDAPVPLLLRFGGDDDPAPDLVTWLAATARETYGVPRSRLPAWLAGQEVVLLLDGLDEGPPDALAARVSMINALRRDNGLLGLAVAGRTDPYRRAGAGLDLRATVRLQPLPDDEIRRFLSAAGVGLTTVARLAGATDTEAAALLRSPLSLTLLTGIAAAAGPAAPDLLGSYVDAMLSRRRGLAPYSRKTTLTGLRWLARTLDAHALTRFRVERIQPDWVPGLSTLAPAIEIGGAAGLIGGYAWSQMSLPVALVALVPLALFFALNPGPDGTTIHPAETVSWSTRGFVRALAVAGAAWPVMLARALRRVRNAVVVVALLVVLGAAGGLAVAEGRPGVAAAVVLGPFVFWWVVLTAAAAFRAALRQELSPQSDRPNAGIRRSGASALRAGALAGLTGGAVVAAAAVPVVDGVGEALIGGGAAALAVATAVAVFAGGRAWLLHWYVRIALARRRLAPFRLVRFLDHAVDVALMRRIGGTYEFYHPTLQRHLADEGTDRRAGASDRYATRRDLRPAARDRRRRRGHQ